NGIVVANAAGSVTITTTGATSDLNLGQGVANGGAVTVSSAHDLNVVAGGQVQARTNVLLTGARNVSVGQAAGAAVSINAGVLSANPAFSPTSTNVKDYDLSAFASRGRIAITATAGTIVLGDAVTMDSFGGSIGLSAGQTITFGQN